MGLQFTENLRNAFAATQMEPQLVLEIDGISTLFSVSKIQKFIRVGDPGLYVDGSWVVGGLGDVENQLSVISFKAGTSNSIRQNLSPDSGVGSSITSVQLSMLDDGDLLSQMISPGQMVEDILGRKAKLYFAFKNTAFPEDALTLFRGIVTDVGSEPALVTMTIDHPDTLKRQKCFKQAKTKLVSTGLVGLIGDLHRKSWGSGYELNDQVTIAAGDFNALLKITGINSSGEVVSADLLSKGSGYVVAQDVACTGGHGSGLTVDILSISELDQNQTEIPVNSTADFLTPIVGPNGQIDPTFRCFALIDDELIQYTGKTETHLTGCTRHALDSLAATHKPGAEITSFYWCRGSAMEIALKFMVSGWGGYFVEGVRYSGAKQHETYRSPKFALLFEQVDLNEKYGVTVGDYVTLSGSASNDFEMKRIESITRTDLGDLMTIEGVTLNYDPDGLGTLSFRSQYDSWPDGLKMLPEYVDVQEHQKIHRLFLSSFEYEFYFKNTMDGKEFLEREVYRPAAAYAVPRKGRSSVTFTTDPIPGSLIQKLDQANIVNPSRIKLRRTISKNFYNDIEYKFDEKRFEDGLSTNVYTLSASSLSRIPVGLRTLEVQSRGMRSFNQGVTLANQASGRRLSRYQYGAEFIDSIEVLLSDGFGIEIGDIVLLDTEDLHVTDTKTGSRTGFRRLYEVVNKTQGLNDGKITLSLLDTNADASIRYGLISPASRIKAGLSETEFMIEAWLPSEFGPNEYRKWEQLSLPAVCVRSEDFEEVGYSVIEKLENNTVKLASPLPFMPEKGMWLEFAPYNLCTEEQKLIYVFMNDSAFEDGRSQNAML